MMEITLTYLELLGFAALTMALATRKVSASQMTIFICVHFCVMYFKFTFLEIVGVIAIISMLPLFLMYIIETIQTTHIPTQDMSLM